MTLFDLLHLIGGLVLFLFGMTVMGNALEKRAGGRMKNIVEKMTAGRLGGFFCGLGITAIIQSSSAVTVMVIGFVNSGLLNLRQALSVIMGANLGTCVTSWLLATLAIDGDSLLLQLLAPSSLTPIIALLGLILCIIKKNDPHRDSGLILIGFSVLMFGMIMISDALTGLQGSTVFREVTVYLSNPLFGIPAGAVVTALLQSSSASVGILQALSTTGILPLSAAIPIIAGQNIGTCFSAVLSSSGASLNARRAAVLHLLFNVIAVLVLLPLFYLSVFLCRFSFLEQAADPLLIAIVHTVFKLAALALLLPIRSLLIRLSCFLVRGAQSEDKPIQLLDERFLAAPAVALDRCRTVALTMAELSVSAVRDSFEMLNGFDEGVGKSICDAEDQADYYEDKLGTYLVRLSAQELSESDSAHTNELLHLIGDFERISDHAVNILDSAREIHEKNLTFSAEARRELAVMIDAVSEILELALTAFRDHDLDSAVMVEPLEQVVDILKDVIKKQHILRLQQGGCTIEMGFILSDVLTNLERISDHCSNIAGCLLEISHESMDMHSYLRRVKGGDTREFNDYFDYFKMKYRVDIL